MGLCWQPRWAANGARNGAREETMRMAPDMQARRDAFLMLTDCKPHNGDMLRWLAVWKEPGGYDNHALFRSREEARAFCRRLPTHGCEHAQLHDLDAQS